MDTNLTVKIRKYGNISILDLQGDVDTYTCGKLSSAFLDLLERGEAHVVVNMAEVGYIDSSGLGTLVGGLRRTRERNGTLAILQASPHILKVFNITGLSKVFQVFSDEVDAVRSLNDGQLGRN
jgi:anti-sigma B factor antagonist